MNTKTQQVTDHLTSIYNNLHSAYAGFHFGTINTEYFERVADEHRAAIVKIVTELEAHAR